MFKTGKTEYNNIALEIRFSKLCHGCIIHFADNDICASLFAFMERRNYYKLLNHSFVSNKYVSQKIHQTIKATKFNFENVLG